MCFLIIWCQAVTCSMMCHLGRVWHVDLTSRPKTASTSRALLYRHHHGPPSLWLGLRSKTTLICRCRPYRLEILRSSLLMDSGYFWELFAVSGGDLFLILPLSLTKSASLFSLVWGNILFTLKTSHLLHWKNISSLKSSPRVRSMDRIKPSLLCSPKSTAKDSTLHSCIMDSTRGAGRPLESCWPKLAMEASMRWALGVHFSLYTVASHGLNSRYV